MALRYDSRLRYLGIFVFLVNCFAQAVICDRQHYSKVFGEERNYRVFLPAGYEAQPERRYPVIYWFHGWGERFNRPGRDSRGYDSGSDYSGDNIGAFVAAHDVIVVKWDGYNPRKPGEEYPRPYNVLPVETYRQFPLYFPELVRHIDSTLRTIPDRAHRGTAGLSMGGFMSFWVAGKYPHLVASASNFMGSSEFVAGPNGFPAEYRHDEMYGNYEGLRTRIVLGTKDFIRWYHRRMNAVWDFTRVHHEHEVFDWDHGTPGMAKTLAFHLEAFRNPLPEPALWHHADVYPSFDVWGYSVATDRSRPGFTAIENVSTTGFRSSVREWLPAGRLYPGVMHKIATAAAYPPGQRFLITDVNLDTGAVLNSRQTADARGRLHFILDGARHEIGISERGGPVLTVAEARLAGALWLTAGKPARLRLSILNKGARAAHSVAVRVTSQNRGIQVSPAEFRLPLLEPGAQQQREVTMRVDDPSREIVRLQVRMGGSFEVPVDVTVFPEVSGFKETVRIADGDNPVVWERAIERVQRRLGAGNADGIANPGETIAVLVPDGDAYRAAELFSSDDCVDLTRRSSDHWSSYDHVGASAKSSLALISSACPEGHEITLFARVQVPNKPEHSLRQGIVRVRVTGADRTPPEPVWAGISHWNRLEVDIRDGSRVVSAAATLESGDAKFRVPLNDDGLEGDAAAGDSVFTGLVPNPPPGRYRLSVFARDQAGNEATAPVASELKLLQ